MKLDTVAIATLALSMAGAAVPTRAFAVQYFEDQGTTPFEDLVHWTNYLSVVDIDGDDDLDVVFANCTGFFTTSPGAQPLLVYRNNGAAVFTNVSATAVGSASMPVRQVAFGDVDGDGDLDMAAPHAGGQAARLYINNGSGVFTDEAATRLAGVNTRAGAARFGDVDGDGDLDLFLADGYGQGIGPTLAHLYINNGSGVFAEATGATPTAVPGYDPDDFDLIDIDRDFDLDLLINMHAGKSQLWLNDGVGVFSDASSRLAAMPGGSSQFDSPYHYGPAVCDVDGDGDLDIWTDNVAPPYAEQLMINDGAGNFTDETAARVNGNAGNADDNGLVCFDVDNDGDLDAAIMSLTNIERILINNGSGNFQQDDTTFPVVNDSTLWLDVGDLNGDGRLDAVTGQGEFGEQRNRLYLGNSSQPIDSRPPRIIAVEDVPDAPPGAPPALRFAVSDRSVGDTGPRLSRAFARVTTSDSSSEVDAHFMGGDIFRAELPDQRSGTEVTVIACAVDPEDNEACSAEQSYLVDESATGPGGGGNVGGGNGAGGPASGGAGGEGGSFDPGDGDGCGCLVVGAASASVSGWWLALALPLLRRRGADRSKTERRRRLSPRDVRAPGARPRRSAAR